MHSPPGSPSTDNFQRFTSYLKKACFWNILVTSFDDVVDCGTLCDMGMDCASAGASSVICNLQQNPSRRAVVAALCPTLLRNGQMWVLMRPGSQEEERQLMPKDCFSISCWSISLWLHLVIMSLPFFLPPDSSFMTPLYNSSARTGTFGINRHPELRFSQQRCSIPDV